jgi:tetratricopeptide (TPR) repeat protein
MSVQSLPDFYQLWDFYDPAKTEAKFLELLPAAQESGDMAYYGELLTQVARTQGLQRRFQDAHKTLDQAESVIPRDAHQARVRLHLERGRALNSSGDKAGAAAPFLEAYALARAHHIDDLEVDAAHMMAIIETPSVALDWNALAIAAAERSENPKARKWLGSLYNNTGWSLYETGEYQNALVMFERAFAFRSEMNQPVETRIAKWCVAKCRRALGEVSAALAMQRELEQEYASLGERSGFVFEEIAECLYGLGDHEAAKPYFAQAYEELCKDQWLVSDEPQRLERLKSLAG